MIAGVLKLEGGETRFLLRVREDKESMLIDLALLLTTFHSTRGEFR